MPSPSPTDLSARLDALLANRIQHLVPRTARDILNCIDQAVQRCLDPHSPERREAEARLPETTGLSSAMVRHVLPLIFREYRADRIEALCVDELGSLEVLDRFVPSVSGRKRASGPPLMTHVLAGNVPGAGLDSVIFSLLVKSATLVKTSSAEPVLPILFARSIRDIDPNLGACLSVVSWPGGNAALEDLAYGRADIVVASGSDASLAAIRKRTRGQFIGYGHKVSFGLATKESLTDTEETAHKAAYDAALYDQQGCLSPQLIYVEEGGAVTPQRVRGSPRHGPGPLANRAAARPGPTGSQHHHPNSERRSRMAGVGRVKISSCTRARTERTGPWCTMPIQPSFNRPCTGRFG